MGSSGNAEYMGTHPIFESDFDCLTDRLKYGRIQVYERNLAQKAIGNDALFATGSCLAIQKPERHPPGFKTNSSRKGSTIGIQGHSRFRRLQNPYSTWWTQEASPKGCHYGQTSSPRCVHAIRSPSSVCCRRACRTSLRCPPSTQLLLDW